MKKIGVEEWVIMQRFVFNMIAGILYQLRTKLFSPTEYFRIQC